MTTLLHRIWAKGGRQPGTDILSSLLLFHHTTPSFLLATTSVSYHTLSRLSLATLALQPPRLDDFHAPGHRHTGHRPDMRPPIYLALCLLSASSSEATLFSRTANRVHHAALRRSAKLAKDIRSVFSNVLIDQPIIGPDTNRVYCVANPNGPVQNPSVPTPTHGGNSTGGGNPVIVSSVSSGSSSSSKRPTPTSSSAGSPVPTPTSNWKLVETRQGASFFDGWDFWNLPGVFIRSIVGNHLLIAPFRSHPRYASLLRQLLHLLNLNVHAHRYR